MDEANKNGDALEQLAREAAEGAQFEFNPSAWSAMEQKLDAPKKGFFWWKLGGGLGLLALILLLVILIPSGEKEGDSELKSPIEEQKLSQRNKSVESTDDVASDSEKVVSSKDGTKDAKVQDNAKIATQVQESDSTITLITSENEINNAESRKLVQEAAGSEANVEKNQLAVNKTVSTGEPQSVTNKVKPLEKSSDRTNNAGEILNTTDSNNEGIGASIATYFDPSQPIVPSDSIESQRDSPYGASLETITPRWVPSVYQFDLSLKPMALDAGYYQTADLDSLQDFKRWSFGVLVSFDLSATGLEGFTNPGTMIGLQAEYRIARNWSIQSGLSYSVKKYRALGEEYDTSTWPGGRSDNLVSALARCLVLDIPINVRRYFKAKNDNQWFVNTGVSTYLMLREDYDYEYATQNPNWSPTGQIRGENNHFFGIANFSVGYETPISKKFGLAFEPFMKLPLTGIGQGKVRFLSLGANVAIKLR